ncbi:hypothetical protein OAL67_01385, partial [bacterium]|nr:hypothetical protein [bacterium]
YTYTAGDIRFNQPVHNIFILTQLESGIFGLFFFVMLLTICVKKALVSRHTLLLISLIQIMFLGSFDHYFITIHQTQLFLWLIIGFRCEYNIQDEK